MPLGPVTSVFEPNRASREEWAALHEYRRRRHLESHQEEPLKSDGLVEQDLLRDHPEEITVVRVSRLDREVTAVGHFWAPRPGAAGYESNRGILWFDLYVLKEHRRVGIATTFLEPLLELANGHQGRVLGTASDESDGLAVLERFGFQKKAEQRYNHLDLAAVDWDLVRSWVAEGQARSPDRTLELYVDGPPREQWPVYSAAITDLFTTIPWDDLEHGDIVITPESMAEQADHFARTGSTMTRILVREPDGRITALTEMLVRESEPEHAHQWLTAVHRTVQGNGIGRWIKSAMLLHLHESHPSLRWVLTDNATSNGPMLKINIELGFRTYRTQSELQISVADFARAVEARR